MKIPVTSTPEKLFIQLVELMSNFAPIKNLTTRGKQLLAELLYQNYIYKNNTEEERRILMFSTENRRRICQKFNITDDNLYFLLNTLRRAGILTKDNRLPKFLTSILPKDKFEFIIEFNLIKDE